MLRVQAALKAQLTKQNEKLEIELREKVSAKGYRNSLINHLDILNQAETLKSLQLQRENVGIELYGVQQHLAKQQMLVEAEQDKHTVTSQLRAQKETTLSQIREFYRNLVQQLKNDRQQSKINLTINAWGVGWG